MEDLQDVRVMMVSHFIILEMGHILPELNYYLIYGLEKLEIIVKETLDFDEPAVCVLKLILPGDIILKQVSYMKEDG